MFLTRRLLPALFATGLALASTSNALAQSWPNKPMRLIVPYPPGGPTDLVGRLYAQKLTEILGQPVVAENKPGANGNIAAQLVAKAPADGGTFILHSSSLVINTLMYKVIGYDAFTDFTPISQLFDYKLMVVVHPSVPVRSFTELVEMAKLHPGKLTYGSAGGAGAPTHLAVEMFKQIAGVNITHVPYQGGAPATNDLLGGHISLMFNNPTQSLPYIKAGQLRGLAVTGLERNPMAPELPTVAELGYPGFDVGTWFALWGPAGLSPEITRAMHAAVAKVAAQQEVKDRLAVNGLRSIAGTPEELARIMRSDHTSWGKVIREADIRIE